MKIERFKENLFMSFEKKCIIEEPGLYSVEVSLPIGVREGVLIDLPKIKSLSNFLNRPSPTCHPPKDCDAIILDPQNYKFYLLETKSRSKTKTATDTREQLLAGKEWLRFLCFCLDVSFEDYEIYCIHVKVNNRQSRGLISPVNDVYTYCGKKVSLRYLENA